MNNSTGEVHREAVAAAELAVSRNRHRSNKGLRGSNIRNRIARDDHQGGFEPPFFCPLVLGLEPAQPPH